MSKKNERKRGASATRSLIFLSLAAARLPAALIAANGVYALAAAAAIAASCFSMRVSRSSVSRRHFAADSTRSASSSIVGGDEPRAGFLLRWHHSAYLGYCALRYAVLICASGVRRSFSPSPFRRYCPLEGRSNRPAWNK